MLQNELCRDRHDNEQQGQRFNCPRSARHLTNPVSVLAEREKAAADGIRARPAEAVANDDAENSVGAADDWSAHKTDVECNCGR